ncbi:DUF805 domain-containing protein [Neisseriaceae bacterium ESL0693]|nr:DUF805 domain-containing protein [Neisseriaceae bacterium ESL0693]
MFSLFISCWTKKCLQFSGRASRKELWSFMPISMIFLFIIALILAVGIPYLYGSTKNENPTQATALILGMFLFSVISVIVIFISQVSLLVRRLHDVDVSGWLVTIYVIVTIIQCTVFPQIGIISLIFWIVLGFLKGTDGPNQFGDDPLEDNWED